MSAPPPGDGGGSRYDGPPAWGPPEYGEPPYPHEPYPGQPFGDQQYPGQQYPGQQYPGQQYPGQPYGGYPQAPYPGGPPARPGRGNLIAVLVAAAVVAVAVLVAVIALRRGGDDGPTVAASSGPTAFPSVNTPSQGSSVPAGIVPSGPGADAVSATLTGVRFFTALTTHDLGAASALGCSGTRLGLTQASVDRVAAALPNGAATTSGSAATMNGTIARTDGSRGDLAVYMRHSGGDWCVDRASGL